MIYRHCSSAVLRLTFVSRSRSTGYWPSLCRNGYFGRLTEMEVGSPPGRLKKGPIVHFHWWKCGVYHLAKTKVYMCVCVCVQPWTKGFPPPLFLSYMSRGMERTREAPSNEAPHVLLGHHQGRLMTYLQSTVAHAVHSFWFDSWFFMCYFPKTAFSRLCIAASRASETFFQQFKSLDLFALLFHHLPSHRDNCVN